jgi:uncharacterized phage-associated protein
MATVFDVAAYILHKAGPMTAMKLQKLVYYAQAWSLVWDEKPIFEEKIRAWAGGPVVPELFKAHQKEFIVKNEAKGKRGALSGKESDTVDAVLKHYGHRDGNWLSALTHKEDPWLRAREGLSDGERGNVEITHGAMANYYGNL